MNVMPLESRRERTQPRRMISLPSDKLNAFLSETNCDAIIAKYRKMWRTVNGPIVSAVVKKTVEFLFAKAVLA
jgi:hypothetical protein